MTPRPTETYREPVAPVASTPLRTPEPEPTRGGAAVIGKAVHIKGQISSREDLYIDGEVEGTVELQEHRLTVGPNGRVLSGVKAREIVVLGTIQGNIEATDKVEIRKEAKLLGDIRTVRIVIEDGAYFKGSIDIVKSDPAKTKPVPTPTTVVTPPASAAAAPPASAPLPVSTPAPVAAPVSAEVRR